MPKKANLKTKKNKNENKTVLAKQAKNKLKVLFLVLRSIQGLVKEPINKNGSKIKEMAIEVIIILAMEVTAIKK